MKRVTKTRTKQHAFLAERDMEGAYLVLRIDDYSTTTASRGQFYPRTERLDDSQKALWSNEADALSAAKWATEKFGNVYGVFKMVAVLERAVAPVKLIKV